MNINRYIKKTTLKKRISSLANITPLSLCILDKKKKKVLSFSNTDKELSNNFPISLNKQIVGELSISEGGKVAEFILQLIQDTLIKEEQIGEIKNETLLMYQEINLLYDLSTTIIDQNSLEERVNYLLEKCSKNLHAENTSIWLISNGELHCKYNIGKTANRTFKLGEGVAGSVAVSGKGEMLNCTIDDPRWDRKGDDSTSLIVVPLKPQQEIIGVLLLSTHTKAPFTSKDLKLANVFAHYCAQEIENNRLLGKIKDETVLRTNLSRFMSPNIVEHFASGQNEVVLGGEKRDVSVLFSDIVGFTAISESLDSEIIVEMLNEYFTSMTDIIFKFNGTVDKFIGDSIMAFFGAPNDVKNYPNLVVKAGLLMQKTSLEMQNNRRLKEKPHFQVRIGINTGNVTIGNIGSPNRLDYTAIGDVVNVASRLEHAAPPGGILIGESTYEVVKNSFKFDEGIDPIKIKGKSKPVKVYRVLDNI